MLGGVRVGSPEVRRGLLISFTDGFMATGVAALMETFAVAGAVALGASSFLIAWIGSLPGLLGALVQVLLLFFADPARGHRHYVLQGVRLQCALLLLAAVAGFAPDSLDLGLYFLGVVGAQAAATAVLGFWSAWMGDLIPQEVRGRHFAWRHRHYGIAALFFSLGAGVLAQSLSGSAAPWTLFCLLFLAAFGMRLISTFLIARQFDPAVSGSGASSSKPILYRFFAQRPAPEFLRFIVLNSLFLAAILAVQPFHTLWYLRDLQLDYLTLSLLACCAGLGTFLSFPFWGKAADRFGNRRIQRLAAFLVCWNGAVFLFFEHPVALGIGSFYGGIAWAGFSLVNFNYILSLAEGPGRVVVLAWNLLIASFIAVALSSLAGYLSTRLPIVLEWRIRSLLLLFIVLRLGIWIFGFGRGLPEEPERKPQAPLPE